jgi:hypothetical protein
MNLENDKRLNIQLRLDFSSVPTGEARRAEREDIESLSVMNKPERRANTLDRSALAQLLEPPYTEHPYVRWCGRGGAARLPPIPILGTNPKCLRAPQICGYRGRADALTSFQHPRPLQRDLVRFEPHLAASAAGMGCLLRATVWQAEALMSRNVLIRPCVRRASKWDSGVAAEISATMFLVARFQVARRPTSLIGDGLGGLGQAYRCMRACCRRALLR